MLWLLLSFIIIKKDREEVFGSKTTKINKISLSPVFVLLPTYLDDEK